MHRRRGGVLGCVWVLLLLALGAGGCRRESPSVSGPLRQRGYLWQREWTPAVVDAVAEMAPRMDGVVALGAEVAWPAGKPDLRRTTIDWESLRRSPLRCSLALRVAPFSGPFAANDANADFIVAAARALLEDAASHQVKVEELQIDFDCAQRNLAGYRLWLGRLRPVVKAPTRLVVTALPAWLEEGEFRSLIARVDGYVLQVHSVPTKQESGRAELFDPDLARRWVAKAAQLRRPFSVALPTYRCVAGYDETGKLLGVYMDSVAPKWPAGTTTREFAADADAIADVVQAWQQKRPPQLQEILWYRAPVASDARNWRWPTLAAVMAGRRPRHELQITQTGGNPLDIALVNAGEAEESLDSIIVANWRGDFLETADALEGWTVVTEPEGARFIPTLPPVLRLAPGARRSIGWLRFTQPTTVELRVEE